MSTETDKNINTSFAVRTVRNVIQMYTTLSDRLKEAGIKENKPKCPGKGCKHKNSKRNKKTQNCYSKAYMSSSFQRTKKFRKPLKHFVMPYTDKSVQNEPLQAETLSKHFEPVQENIPETEENVDKETIFASLDFIEDCQNYKKKVRKQMTQRGKSLRSLTSHQKQDLDTGGSSQKSIGSAEREEASPREDGESGDYQTDENPTESEKLMSVTEKEVLWGSQRMTPLLDSSENIAKIDKKYLDLIMSLAKKLEAKEQGDEGEIKSTETHTETKKKLTGRDFFEMKLKTKECQEEVLRKDSSSMNGDAQTELKDTLNSSRTDARIVRDLTKSEEQVKLKKGKNVFDSYNNNNNNNNNSKMKTKNVTHSKPDINDMSRKKRKPRNKFMKSNAKEFIETSLLSEVTRVADVKELWRRKTLMKKSENSLTSHSSCTVPETDECPAGKNLEPYKILKKLVEKEVTNISKKSENKNNTEEVKTKENNPKQSELRKKPPIYRKTNELSILKRRLLLAEGNMEKPELLSLLGEDVPKEANPKLVSTEEKAKNGKIPSKIIENWSILNRLEQAFLGLGTPTFPDKNIKTNIKSKRLNGNEGILTAVEKIQNETKKVQKYREVLAKKDNKCSTIQRNAPKTPNKTESGNKVSALKEETPIKSKKMGKLEPQYLHERNTPKAEKTNSKQKKKLQNIPEWSPSCNPSPLQDTRRGAKETQLTISQTRLQIKVKYQNMIKKKAANLKKASEENLERKKTFDVIPAIDESIIQPRKSKSCGINDTSLERCSSQTRTQDFSKDGRKIRSKSFENDTKIMTAVPERLAKDPIRDVTTCEQTSNESGKITNVDEKECLKESRETTPTEQRNQEKVVKNLRVTEELPKDLLSGTIMFIVENNKINNDYDDKTSAKNKETNNSNTVKERVVKKRSILSVNGNNQHCEQATRKLLQIEEKNASITSLENVYRSSEKEFKSSFSSISIINAGTVKLADINTENHAKGTVGQARFKQQGKFEISQRSTTSRVNNSTVEDSDEEEEEQGEWRTRKQQLWEQDMTHYRSIVKEIMSQYKRIDGFLKQNEQLSNFTTDSSTLSSLSNDTSKSENDSQILNIHEYRKKIITEYNELPIFEYKSKMEQNKEGSCSESIRKRNLLVVKDFNTDVDDDVKDYQPKVQKVLDSQIYVDTERLVRRNEPKCKFNDKIPSLQDIVLRKKEEKIFGEEWQRSTSTPRALQRHSSYVILSNAHVLPSQGNVIENTTSDSTTCYGQDTETESSPEISSY